MLHLQRAQFAIADLTITPERRSAVDFSMPFMNLGVGILYKQPKYEPPYFFSYHYMFLPGVWLMLGVAYLTTFLLLAIAARYDIKYASIWIISHYECNI
jgi:glutamate receptor, ionotropic, invertebrate